MHPAPSNHEHPALSGALQGHNPCAEQESNMSLSGRAEHLEQEHRPTRLIRVVVADKEQLVAQALAQLLDTEQDLEVVGVYADAPTLLRGLLARQPDVVVLDPLGLAGLESELLRHIRAAHPDLAVIVVTADRRDQQLFAAIRAGVRGYLSKTASLGDLRQAIRAAASGGGALSPMEAQRLMDAYCQQTQNEIGLTPRQREMLAGIVYGNGNKEIAQALGLAEKTVKNYMQELFSVLGVSNRTAAAVQALRLNLVSAPDWAPQWAGANCA
jgi:DNA-binding NarL/FixJ family response regulator